MTISNKLSKIYIINTNECLLGTKKELFKVITNNNKKNILSIFPLR